MTISPSILNQVHRQDCVAGMNGLPAGSVDLVFADPPFNIGYDYDEYDDSKECAHYLDWSGHWIGAVHRVLKPDGTFWLAIGDEYAAELKVLSQKIGFHCRSWVVWYYTFGVNCKYKFSRSHAHLFHFVKDLKNCTFLGDEPENRIPSARQLVYGDARANPRGRLPDDTWILRPQDLADCFTPSEDTWYFPRVAGTFKERAGFHGCQMPEQLLGRILRACSRENELVLDPFAGSSTTLVVAKKLGRLFLGFDLSADYVKRGTERLAAARRGDPLEGAAEPTVSAPATPVDLQGKKRSSQAKVVVDPVAAARAKQEHAVAAKAESILNQQLLDAFSRTNDGHSLDRVLADPELNGRFAERCRFVGLVGEPRVWNWRLLNLRKQGLLANIPTSRRTEVSWQDCDAYSYASEIALSLLLAEGYESVDEVLCDPQAAGRFDGLAASFAPGHSPFEYRWAAIKLRKDAKLARTRAALLTAGRFTRATPIAGVDWTSIPESAGIYVVGRSDESAALYVGESFNLRARLQKQFEFSRPEIESAWRPFGPLETLEVRSFVAEPRSPELLAFQSLVARQHKSRLNFPELVGA